MRGESNKYGRGQGPGVPVLVAGVGQQGVCIIQTPGAAVSQESFAGIIGGSRCEAQGSA